MTLESQELADQTDGGGFTSTEGHLIRKWVILSPSGRSFAGAGECSPLRLNLICLNFCPELDTESRGAGERCPQFYFGLYNTMLI